MGAGKRLLTHVQLVGEAADSLITCYEGLGILFDAQLLELGVAIHDAGKILHPQELDAPGSLHEPAGETLLLAHGVQNEIARCCVSHAAWHQNDLRFEELSIALADKLWKGKREEALELKIIDAIAQQLGKSRWDVFAQLDTAFEEIAAGGNERLSRSR
ncbi:hypothetical protein [Undibacterium sp. TJN19]|uniref:hypothetical protein n=1 Tax=Undibacterium sp. TJN19 TaxID=3413055 RepID=UPI003BF1415D